MPMPGVHNQRQADPFFALVAPNGLRCLALSIKMKISTIFIILVVFSQAAKAEQLLIGVAEQSEYENLHGKAIVRALFVKSEGSWVALDSQDRFKSVPSEITWNVAFDGRNFGILETIDSFNEKYSGTFKRNKILKIKNSTEFPLLGNKESRFGGWRKTPENRPLVVVSQPNYKDIEKWKRYKPAKEIEMLYPLVKEKIPQAYHCNGAPKWDAVKIAITMDDISIFRSYKNNKDEKLISIGLSNRHTKNCDGPLDKTSKPMWFYIADGIKFVGFELDLVDAGDYDADGEVEFMFWHGGYNNDGYTLYESNFEERFDYYWDYH